MRIHVPPIKCQGIKTRLVPAILRSIDRDPDGLWSRFTISTRQHFYHVGAREANRKPMLEALVTNYAPATPADPLRKSKKRTFVQEQLMLFERSGRYLDTADTASAGRPSAGGLHGGGHLPYNAGA